MTSNMQTPAQMMRDEKIDKQKPYHTTSTQSSIYAS